jgi:hypothetical protein
MLWVHVAADFNAIVSKQRKAGQTLRGFQKPDKIQAATPPGYFCASVHSTGVRSRESYILTLSIAEYRA